jgi:hypothetical protein
VKSALGFKAWRGQRKKKSAESRTETNFVAFLVVVDELLIIETKCFGLLI